MSTLICPICHTPAKSPMQVLCEVCSASLRARHNALCPLCGCSLLDEEHSRTHCPYCGSKLVYCAPQTVRTNEPLKGKVPAGEYFDRVREAQATSVECLEESPVSPAASAECPSFLAAKIESCARALMDMKGKTELDTEIMELVTRHLLAIMDQVRHMESSMTPVTGTTEA